MSHPSSVFDRPSLQPVSRRHLLSGAVALGAAGLIRMPITIAENAGDAWWQTGVIYQIYPRSFLDTNGDGVGDLAGITEKLDYLQWLGVDALWISPVYPSPMADFGYDISDFEGVDPLFGTLGDMDALIGKAQRLGLKVMLDWVPNHTSDQHPWFIESRASRDNPKRDWYVWHDPAPDGGVPSNWQSVFGGPVWEWDDSTGQYYYHAFLREQPDLNWRNPEVVARMHETLRFWLDRGVDGFRVDAYFFLFEDEQLRDNPPGTTWNMSSNTANLPEIGPMTESIRQLLDEYDDRAMIGEIYLPIEEAVSYYGTAGAPQFHMVFNFGLTTDTLWNARDVSAFIGRYDAALPEFATGTWVLGNHDQHRLASRIGEEQTRVAAMLLTTLRGTPTLYYGDEIGMINGVIAPDRVRDPLGKIFFLFGRDPERTPMQWTSGPLAGFTDGEPWLPINSDSAKRNVERQREDPDSLLSLYQRLLALRRVEPALKAGRYREVLVEGSVYVYERATSDRRFLVALNFGAKTITAALPGDEEGVVVVCTSLAREGVRVAGAIDLAPNEGAVIAVD